MIGYETIKHGKTLWRKNQGGLLPISPPNTISEHFNEHTREILKDSETLFVRWETNFDQTKESNWWHIIKDSPESLDELPKKTRYQIRKASKKFMAKPTNIQKIIEQGYHVYSSAYERYKTHEIMFTKNEFRDSIEKLPKQTEWWGVFDYDTERLVAFSENYIENKTCFYVTMWFEPDAMQNCAGYLLFHEMELHYLKDRDFLYISDGSRSLSHNTNIHHFLESKFNFRRAYSLLNVTYVSWLAATVKLAFPFKELIRKLPFSFSRKASVLLDQEGIRRKCAISKIHD